MNGIWLGGRDTFSPVTWTGMHTFTASPTSITLTGVPTGTTATTSTLVVNPASATANADLLWLGIAGVAKFQVDEDGDTTASGVSTASQFAQGAGAFALLFSSNYSILRNGLGNNGTLIYSASATPGRHRFTAGTGAFSQLTLTAPLNQYDVTAKRDVDCDGNNEDGAVVRIWRDVTNGGTIAGDFAIWTNDGTTALGKINTAGGIDAPASTFGDLGVTSYTEFAADGAIIFHGEAGLVFAEIYVQDNAVATVIAVATTLVQVTIFGVDGASNNCTPDHTNDHITIDNAGRYLVTLSCTVNSVGGGGADLVKLQMQKNNGATPFANLHAHRKLGTGGGGDTGSISISGIIDVAATDTIEVWIANDSSTDNLLVSDATLSLVQLAGT